MATRNIVPRGNEEGNIGTQLKNWLKGWFKDIFVSGNITNGSTNINVMEVRNFIDSKSQVGGLAELDIGGKVPIIQIPDSVIGQLKYKGIWDALANTPALNSGGIGGTKGDYYVISVAGTTLIDTINDWSVGDWIVHNGFIWEKIDNTDKVSSVNGQTGVVTLNLFEYKTITVSTSVTAGNNNVILCDAIAGTITITLPSASSFLDKIYIIKKIDNSANFIIIDGNGDTIDGESTMTTNVQNTAITIISDGTNWYII